MTARHHFTQSSSKSASDSLPNVWTNQFILCIVTYIHTELRVSPFVTLSIHLAHAKSSSFRNDVLYTSNDLVTFQLLTTVSSNRFCRRQSHCLDCIMMRSPTFTGKAQSYLFAPLVAAACCLRALGASPRFMNTSTSWITPCDGA